MIQLREKRFEDQNKNIEKVNCSRSRESETRKVR